MKKKFIETEKEIIKILMEADELFYRGSSYEVDMCDKPKTARGEPKTDVFLRLRSGSDTIDIKISIKQNNADFLENKITKDRAQQILGDHWKDRIIKSLKDKERSFLERHLIFIAKRGNTEPGSFTLGWRFELMNKLSGELSGEMKLDRNEVYDVYSGKNLDESKRNSEVSNIKIKDSGVASHILVVDPDKIKGKTAQELLNSLITIEDYVSRNPIIYFSCKAVNYRSSKDKIEGARHLSVYVDWYDDDGKLDYKLIFDKPLEYRANEVKETLKGVLSTLGLNKTIDIKDLKVTNPIIVYSKKDYE